MTLAYFCVCGCVKQLIAYQSAKGRATDSLIGTRPLLFVL